MSIRYQILCSVKKTTKGKETITQIGGRNPLGEVWSLKLDQVVEGIRSGQWEFFVNYRGVSFPVQISESDGEIELTALDKEKNLLHELPKCPD